MTKVKIKIIPSEKKMGMKVEREHNDVTHGDPKLVEKIVMAHLKEVPDYYTKLKEIVEKED